jgi:small-conductance mechanosensitive channel
MNVKLRDVTLQTTIMSTLTVVRNSTVFFTTDVFFLRVSNRLRLTVLMTTKLYMTVRVIRVTWTFLSLYLLKSNEFLIRFIVPNIPPVTKTVQE